MMNVFACPGCGLALEVRGVDAVKLAPEPHGLGQGYYTISRREADVLKCLSRGLSTRETAAKLKLCVQTIRSYLKTLYATLKVHTAIQAVLIAQSGYVMVRNERAK